MTPQIGPPIVGTPISVVVYAYNRLDASRGESDMPQTLAAAKIPALRQSQPIRRLRVPLKGFKWI